MISIITGPPGNGKSLLTQSVTVEEYVHTDRDIVTSTPVRLNPWMTGDERIQMGLIAYMQIALKIKMPEPVQIRKGIVACGKLLVVEDETELSTLFMWRRDRKTGDWFKLRWDVSGQQFHQDDLARMGTGQFIVTDEAWKCYSSRRWKDSEMVTEFYGRQHRKFGDDWHLVSHSHKDLDVQINRMAQQWQICKNYGLRRISVFRQPPVFEVKTFYEPPASASVKAFHTTIRRLDKRVAETYDTSAGVAVGGGRGADVKRRKKGISLIWLGVAVCLGIGGLMSIPKLAGMSVQRFMNKSLGIPDKSKGLDKTNSVPEAKLGTTQTVVLATSTNQWDGFETNRVSGVTSLGGQIRYFLTDGTVRTVRFSYHKDEAGIHYIDGKKYREHSPNETNNQRNVATWQHTQNEKHN